MTDRTKMLIKHIFTALVFLYTLGALTYDIVTHNWVFAAVQAGFLVITGYWVYNVWARGTDSLWGDKRGD